MNIKQEDFWDLFFKSVFISLYTEVYTKSVEYYLALYIKALQTN